MPSRPPTTCPQAERGRMRSATRWWPCSGCGRGSCGRSTRSARTRRPAGGRAVRREEGDLPAAQLPLLAGGRHVPERRLRRAHVPGAREGGEDRGRRDSCGTWPISPTVRARLGLSSSVTAAFEPDRLPGHTLRRVPAQVRAAAHPRGRARSRQWRAAMASATEDPRPRRSHAVLDSWRDLVGLRGSHRPEGTGRVLNKAEDARAAEQGRSRSEHSVAEASPSTDRGVAGRRRGTTGCLAPPDNTGGGVATLPSELVRRLPRAGAASSRFRTARRWTSIRRMPIRR